MADGRMALLETLRKATLDGDVDVLREGVRVLAQAIMEVEVSELTAVPHGERDPDRRLTHRNGYRERAWDTRVGTIALDIPRVRDGSLFPESARATQARRAPCWRSSRRPTSGASARAGWTISCGPSASRASAAARSAGCVRRSMPRSRPSAAGR